MRTVCASNKCAGCGACLESCSKRAITINASVEAYNAVIDEEKCVECGLCQKVCPQNTTAEYKMPLFWKQGWALDETERAKSSSGGYATAIMKGFIRRGGVVWSCEFKNGEFSFSKSTSEVEVEKYCGSKYVKSNPVGIYKDIRTALANGNKVLFLGLPCQVAAIKNYMGDNFYDNLYTIDLICHGTPSPRLLQEFLQQDFDLDLAALEDIQFRDKGNFGVNTKNEQLVKRGKRDRYLMAFLDSIDYTENCYECKYAQTKRISDLTIGDSWGSTLSQEERDKGISLVLCQTAKGQEILDMAEIYMTDVDVEKALNINTQLREPVKMTDKVRKFRKLYKRKGFHRTMNSLYRKYYIKQFIKSILGMLGFKKYRGGVVDSYFITIKK